MAPQVVSRKDVPLCGNVYVLRARVIGSSINPIPFSGSQFTGANSGGAYSTLVVSSSPSVCDSSVFHVPPEQKSCNLTVSSPSCMLPSIQLSASQPIQLIQSVFISPQTGTSSFPWRNAPAAEEPTAHSHSLVTHCTCSKTRCLKLYCNCLRAGRFCTAECECVKCMNKCDSVERQQVLRKARSLSLRTKQLKKEGKECVCSCQKSQCNKNYCSCFQAGRYCTDKCKCVDCCNRSSDAYL